MILLFFMVTPVSPYSVDVVLSLFLSFANTCKTLLYLCIVSAKVKVNQFPGKIHLIFLDNVPVSECDADCRCCPLLSLSSQRINWIMGNSALEKESPMNILHDQILSYRNSSRRLLPKCENSFSHVWWFDLKFSKIHKIRSIDGWGGEGGDLWIIGNL